MKTCSKCKRILPLEMFHKKKESPDGHRYDCKICKSEAEKRHYRKTPERRKRRVSQEVFDRYCAKWPERRKAKTDVHNAIARGDLIRGRCKVCGGSKVQAHHPDYSKPLDVVWLCQKHHTEAHDKFKKYK